MKLNEQIEQELINVIKARGNDAAFPIEVLTSGKIKHLIAKEKQGSGHFLTAIEHDGQEYLIYLIA